MAFENSNTPDYVTEKVFQALEAGTVPSIYFILLLYKYIIIIMYNFKTNAYYSQFI